MKDEGTERTRDEAVREKSGHSTLKSHVFVREPEAL